MNSVLIALVRIFRMPPVAVLGLLPIMGGTDISQAGTPKGKEGVRIFKDIVNLTCCDPKGTHSPSEGIACYAHTASCQTWNA